MADGWCAAERLVPVVAVVGISLLGLPEGTGVTKDADGTADPPNGHDGRSSGIVAGDGEGANTAAGDRVRWRVGEL